MRSELKNLIEREATSERLESFQDYIEDFREIDEFLEVGKLLVFPGNKPLYLVELIERYKNHVSQGVKAKLAQFIEKIVFYTKGCIVTNVQDINIATLRILHQYFREAGIVDQYNPEIHMAIQDYDRRMEPVIRSAIEQNNLEELERCLNRGIAAPKDQENFSERVLYLLDRYPWG